MSDPADPPPPGGMVITLRRPGVRPAATPSDFEAPADNVVDLLVVPVRSHPAVPPGRRCRHLSTVVDGPARQVTCGECGAMLDPIEALMTLCERGDAFVRLEGRIRVLNRSIASLLAEEKRLKARVGRWRKKPGAFDAAKLMDVVAGQLDKYRGFDQKHTVVRHVITLLETMLEAMKKTTHSPSED